MGINERLERLAISLDAVQLLSALSCKKTKCLTLDSVAVVSASESN